MYSMRKFNIFLRTALWLIALITLSQNWSRVYVDLYGTVPECYKMSTLPINVIGCSSHVVVRKWNPKTFPVCLFLILLHSISASFTGRFANTRRKRLRLKAEKTNRDKNLWNFCNLQTELRKWQLQLHALMEVRPVPSFSFLIWGSQCGDHEHGSLGRYILQLGTNVPRGVCTCINWVHGHENTWLHVYLEDGRSRPHQDNTWVCRSLLKLKSK